MVPFYSKATKSDWCGLTGWSAVSDLWSKRARTAGVGPSPEDMICHKKSDPREGAACMVRKAIGELFLFLPGFLFNFFLIELFVLVLEFVDPAGRVDQFGLTGVERM